MALPFYRARPGEPMGVELRRRFGFQQGEKARFLLLGLVLALVGQA